ncbi:LysR family transcriptional regulator [Blastomonas fulva]|uniref:LysR family transcriptional regulator n=1 Tax=Blastomonas fulva TaxID=1550728 RepID=UPI0025A37CFC|nr:LysR family transcriptional regulator [Blastomonas fulva]MDM7928770.1 LysR family transcriptional regulator [Blastomonas fulva]MDM7964556.1 LysR family transcriptional regulator [Blastomonas fulva]
MTFDQRKLSAFVAVVDTGSVGRAAIVNNMTQPTLSRLIREMEQRLGVDLFERHSKGMTLTASGEVFAPYARMLLFEMQQASEALDAVQGIQRGTVRLGAVAAATRSLVPKASARLLKAASALRIALLEAPQGTLTEALLARKIDLMIAPQLPDHPDMVRISQCQFDDVFTVFCSTQHPLARASDVDLERVLKENWVMPPAGSTPRSLFDALVRKSGQALPTVAIEATSVGAQVACVVHGRVLGWLPHPLIESEVGNGTIKLLTIPELSLHRSFYVYRRSRGLLPDAARRFLEMLPQVAETA